MINWLASGDFAGTASYRFASRYGGVSSEPFAELNVASWVGDEPDAVAKNLSILSEQTGVTVKAMRPEHGTTVQDVVGDEDSLKIADILVTTNTNVGLLAPSADCASIFAASNKKNFLIAAHVGWRGAAAGIAAKLLTTAELYGVRSDEMEMVLGPAICGWCYPVSIEVHDAVTAQLPAASTRSSTFTGVDLRIGLVNYFKENGVSVINQQPCTFESPSLFSYRRDNQTGRQAAIAWLN